MYRQAAPAFLVNVLTLGGVCVSILRKLLVLFFVSFQALPASAATSSSECLFNWVEKNYATYFAPAAASSSLGNYDYRYYSTTKSYLALANDTQHVVYVGPLSNNGVLDLGKFSDWLSMAGCPAQTNSAAVTSQFFDFYYLQNVNGVPAATGSIVDNGANKLGSVTFGTSATTAGFTPQANGNGYSWNSPVSYGNGFGSNPGDVNVPAVAMVCQSVPGNGGSRGKTTDVLVTKSATAITSAADLAGVQFSSYNEDCFTESSSSAVVDGSGNVTFNVVNNGTPATISLTASQFSTALSGSPVSNAGNGSMTTFNAYRYTDSQSGQVRYVLVEHGAATATNVTRGYLGVWLMVN